MNEINWSIQQWKVFDVDETRLIIPRGMGTTTAIVNSAMKDIEHGLNVLVIVNNFDGVGEVCDKIDYSENKFEWYVDNDKATIKSNVTGCTVEFLSNLYGKPNSITLSKMTKKYGSIYSDCVNLRQEELDCIPCIATSRYMIVENKSKE